MDMIPTHPARTDASHTAAAEYRTLVTMLRDLDDSQWEAATECTPWTVRDPAAHLAGAAEESVRLRVQLRHLRGARRRVGKVDFVDALNEQQLADREGALPADLIGELADLGIRAPRARRRTPWFIRGRNLPVEAGGPPDKTMAYLLDVIYTRDIWMHRIDIARATRSDLPDSGVEATVVGQVVRDLERAWAGQPFILMLTGRVTGTWPIGPRVTETPPCVEVDAVAACRLWSGRSDETGLRPDDPLTSELARVRLLF